MDIVREATRRRKVPTAQCHVRHVPFGGVFSACPGAASGTITAVTTADPVACSRCSAGVPACDGCELTRAEGRRLRDVGITRRPMKRLRCEMQQPPDHGADVVEELESGSNSVGVEGTSVDEERRWMSTSLAEP